MADTFNNEILVVDDDDAVRDIIVRLLKVKGYNVNIAKDGFDALLQLKKSVPAVVLSDLNMPKMSGFELLSILRRRYPQIGVIAMSGGYDSTAEVPGGVIADAFLAKGQADPTVILGLVTDLIQTAEAHTEDHKRETAPVWIPRNGKDAKGVPFVILNCTECLRSFPFSVATEELHKIQETPCLFCSGTIRYVVDFSRSINSPRIEGADWPVSQAS